MKEVILKAIEKAAATGSAQEAIKCLSVWVSYQVTVAEPNVVRYWNTLYGIKGRLVF
jgi:hypothetical protein